MGSKNKLKRYRQNELFENVIQPERQQIEEGLFPLKGQWHKTFFKNEHPIVLELGCGKGEYSVHLAKQNKHKNFIGIDIKGARFWRGAKTAIDDGMQNIGFLRTQIELITACFAADEVDEIWITFPDPQIKFKRTKHRLTNPEFLNKYKQILKPQGVIHLKTDSEFLHGYTLGVLEHYPSELLYAHHDIYNNLYSPKHATAVQTFYEKIFLAKNKAITYMQFKLL